MELFRKRVPVVFQIEAAECGAASLCMILAYYGKHVDLREMREECHISRDGSKLSFIMEAARKYGLEPTAYRSFPQLIGRTLPLIAFWKFSHFLVVERISEKWVYLVDPAEGRRRVTKEEFARDFSGVVLELKKTEEFKQGGTPEDTLAPIREMIGSQKAALLFLTLLTLMLNIVGLVLPMFSTMFIDVYLPHLGSINLTGFFAAFLAVILLEFILLHIRKQISLRFKRIQSASMTGRVIEKLLKLPASYFGTRSHTVIDMNLGAIESLTEFLVTRFVPLFLDLLFSVLYIALLFSFSVRLAVPTLLITLITIIVIRIMLKWSEDAAIRSRGQLNGFMGAFVQSVRLFDSIKSVALEEQSYMDMMKKYSGYQDSCQNSNKIRSVIQAIPATLPMLLQIVVISIGAIEVVNGRLTLGQVLACQVLATSIFMPIMNVIAEFSSLQGQKLQLSALQDIERSKTEQIFAEEESSDEEAKELTGEVYFDSVTFGYNTQTTPVLQNVSFSIGEGECVAFVGGSGSGKSTILRLMEGLYAPQSGRVLIGGRSLNTITKKEMSEALAVVSQTPQLFEGTVRDNITLFDRSISIEEVEAAARAACVFDAIESHAAGFNEEISTADCSFSGGEIQRIMIARALVRRPKLLLLDEATSALDTIVEEEVMNNIKALGITLVIVAHRLSAIRDSKTIYVLDKGEIVQLGTHEELSSVEGQYLSLISTEEENG
ncbi:MAG: ATP-binding cassette domain-containing protein [Eubacteriales bacterium]|nr:ATP-binding cassette domain-containing protein [Eubacteriales bacterium]